MDRDTARVEAKLLTCSAEEIEGYVWDVGGDRQRGEQTMKADEHGMDGERYVVAHRDIMMGRKARGRVRRGDGDEAALLGKLQKLFAEELGSLEYGQLDSPHTAPRSGSGHRGSSRRREAGSSAADGRR